MRSRLRFGLPLVLVLAATFSGCGDDDASNRASGSQTTGTSSQTVPGARSGGDGAGPSTTGSGSSTTTNQALDPATRRTQARRLRRKRQELQREGKDPSRARPLPDGSVIVVAPKPQPTSVAGSDVCAQGDVPPRPGLRAEFAEDSVRVTIDTGHPPQECRPDSASVTIGAETGPYPTIRSDVRIRELRPYVIQIPLPDTPGTPDVATAVAGIKGGGDSPPARVRITR